MKYFSLFLIIFALTLFPTVDSFGDHGSGGGGCSGDCTPPTMGTDLNSNISIENGFTINQKSFDVDYYSQTIPTQEIPIGVPAEISLKIYENSGSFYLSNVQLKLGEKEEFIGGQSIVSHPVQITWEQALDGRDSYFVIDENEFLSNVSVKSFVDGDPAFENIITITFGFTPVSDFDANTVIVTMWDHNLSSWTNYFYDALEITSKNNDNGIPKTLEYATLLLPDWIKQNAGFWAKGLIDDDTFLVGISYCINEEIIQIPEIPNYSPNVLHFVDLDKGPQHYIDRYNNEPSYKEWFDSNFPEYSIEEAVGLNPNSSKEIPDWIKSNAGWWAEDLIDDQSFVDGISYMIENGIIIV